MKAGVLRLKFTMNENTLKGAVRRKK